MFLLNKITKNFTFLIILKSITLIQSISSNGRCGSGNWVEFHNEKCILFIDKLVTQPEAKELCRAEGQINRKSNLISIDSTEEDDFINEYLIKFKIIDSFWIDLTRVNESQSIFHNTNGEEPEYDNWGPEKPSVDLKKRCVQIKPPTEGMINPLKGRGVLNGKWEDAVCFKKNLVLCQKYMEWDDITLQRIVLKTQRQLMLMRDMFKEINRKTDDLSSKQLKSFDNRLDVIISQFHQMEGQLTQITNKTNLLLEETHFKVKDQMFAQVPIGFVYIQLPGQSDPKILWPGAEWTDISGNYSGLFFRVVGNGSAPFYQIQRENCPRLVAVSTKVKKGVNKTGPKESLESDDKWSKEIFTGYESEFNSNVQEQSMHYLSFKVSAGEVRPTNTAVLIWQRTN